MDETTNRQGDRVIDEQNFIEKLGIVQTLNEIKIAQVEKNAKLDQVLAWVQEHHKTLYGVNGSPGLDKSVDRLLAIEQSREKHFWVIYPALVISLAKHAMDYLRNK